MLASRSLGYYWWGRPCHSKLLLRRHTLRAVYLNPNILYLRSLPLTLEGFLWQKGPELMETGIFEKEPNDLTDGSWVLAQEF